MDWLQPPFLVPLNCLGELSLGRRAGGKGGKVVWILFGFFFQYPTLLLICSQLNYLTVIGEQTPCLYHGCEFFITILSIVMRRGNESSMVGTWVPAKVNPPQGYIAWRISVCSASEWLRVVCLFNPIFHPIISEKNCCHPVPLKWENMS